MSDSAEVPGTVEELAIAPRVRVTCSIEGARHFDVVLVGTEVPVSFLSGMQTCPAPGCGAPMIHAEPPFAASLEYAEVEPAD